MNVPRRRWIDNMGAKTRIALLAARATPLPPRVRANLLRTARNLGVLRATRSLAGFGFAAALVIRAGLALVLPMVGMLTVPGLRALLVGNVMTVGRIRLGRSLSRSGRGEGERDGAGEKILHLISPDWTGERARARSVSEGSRRARLGCRADPRGCGSNSHGLRHARDGE